MESAGSGPPENTDLEEIPCVPIASLDPSRPPPSNISIRAVVSLVWPYSSSHRTFALLLAEPDFRLRRNRGQIRVQLKGPIAEALAKSHVGIGDFIRLSLSGSQWVEDAVTVKTPGRSVDADLLFKSRILLQITRDGDQQPVLSLEHTESPPPEPHIRIVTTPQEPRSPLPETPRQVTHLSRSWRTPARLYSSIEADHPSSSEPYNLFGDEDAFDNQPTKRAKFGRGTHHWRLVDRNSRSPDEDVPASPRHGLSQLDGSADYRDAALGSVVFGDLVQAGSSDDALQANAVTLADPAPSVHSLAKRSDMSPPDLHKIQINIDVAQSQQTQVSSVDFLRPTTPSLEPIPSAVLPQVSPFTSFEDSYFPQQVAESREHHMSDTDIVQEFPQASQDEIVAPSLAIGQQRAQEDRRVEIDQDIPTFASEPTVENGGGSTAAPLLPELLNVDFEVDGKSNMIHPEAALQSHDWYSLAQHLKSFDSGMQPLDNALVSDPNAADLLPDQAPNVPVSSEVTRDGMGDALAVEITPGVVHGVDTQDPLPKLVWPVGYYDVVEDLYGRPEPASELPDPLPIAEEPSQTGVEGRATQTQAPGILTPEASQETASRRRRPPSLGHRVDEILDGQLPPTPQLSEIPSGMVEASEVVSPVHEQQRDDQATRMPTGRRRSSVLRINEVPKTISAWFTARHQSATSSDNVGQTDIKTRDTSSKEQQYPTPAVGFDFGGLSRDYQTKDFRHEMLESRISDMPSDMAIGGLRTPLSYYSPVSSLDRHINGSSQVGENLVDVIVVATSPTATPDRAKSGPKDYFTYLNVADSLSFPDTLQVQIFRSFKSSLPRADAGDVLLFRNFSVKSRKGKSFLVSGESSAWHVWRYSQVIQFHNNDEVPIWARKTQKALETRDEECNGPPVEIGPEERQHSLAMRYWWESLKQKDIVGRNDMTNGHDVGVAGSVPNMPSSEVTV